MVASGWLIGLFLSHMSKISPSYSFDVLKSPNKSRPYSRNHHDGLSMVTVCQVHPHCNCIRVLPSKSYSIEKRVRLSGQRQSEFRRDIDANTWHRHNNSIKVGYPDQDPDNLKFRCDG